MEGMEDIPVENSEARDERLDLSAGGYMLSSSSFKGADNIGNDSAFYEKFLLEDLDSYWDDLTVRLTVSRMVSDSIIKGMVGAVAEEAADRIASKEAEIVTLNERLRSCELEPAVTIPKSSAMKVETQKIILELQQSYLESTATEHLGRLRTAVEEQLQNLEMDDRVDALKVMLAVVFDQMNSMFCSMKSSTCDQQWEHDIQREVVTTVIQDSMRGLHDEFGTKLCEQRRLIETLNTNWQKKVAELSAMREELDAISRSLLSSEPGLLFPHNNLESFEEWNSSKRKDHFPNNVSGNHHPEENGTVSMEKSGISGKLIMEIADFSYLKHMGKEELMSYIKTEMTQMRRHHDSVLQENTEELFRLKREFLKEKGSSPFRKDKEFEALRKRILEIILKLDDVLLEKEKPFILHYDHDELSSLKYQINTVLLENQRLRGLLTDKRKEVKCLSSQISDAATQMSLHSSAEANSLKQIKNLKEDMEDVKIEAKIMQEIYSIILRGVIGDATSIINPTISKYLTEKAFLEAVLFEKEKTLFLESDENGRLKQEIMLLSTSMREKEKFASDAGSTLKQQKEHFDLVNQELCILRDQVRNQELLLFEKNTELDSMKSRLNGTLHRMHQYKMEASEVNKKFKIASDALEEAEKQKAVLHDIIDEKQNTMSSSIIKEKEQAKQMKCIITSVIELSRAVEDFVNKITEIIKRHESRLEILSHQCIPLPQEASLLRKKGFSYKQILEIKSSNLQKAENEVDLLGNEVDALLSLLGKIYIALDHYAPVFELYPGVMDILKLVQRELKGEAIRLV